jgi:hypothetical protein
LDISLSLKEIREARKLRDAERHCTLHIDEQLGIQEEPRLRGPRFTRRSM